jgi:hypothetical protein
MLDTSNDLRSQLHACACDHDVRTEEDMPQENANQFSTPAMCISPVSAARRLGLSGCLPSSVEQEAFAETPWRATFPTTPRACKGQTFPPTTPRACKGQPVTPSLPLVPSFTLTPPVTPRGCLPSSVEQEAFAETPRCATFPTTPRACKGQPVTPSLPLVPSFTLTPPVTPLLSEAPSPLSPVCKKALVEQWSQERGLPFTQFIGVLRHTERADSDFATLGNRYWTRSDDCKKFPLDPPLSDDGVTHAMKIGQQLHRVAIEKDVVLHSVVTSPYLRCIQTALEVCVQLGADTNLIVDYSLGEIYGPCVMGTNKPNGKHLVRDTAHIIQLCRSRGVTCDLQHIGKWPRWPEKLETGRSRFANRFLTYLRRGVRVRRNFLIVTHADCVGSSLSVMPSQVGVEKIEFGGMFLAHRLLSSLDAERSRCTSEPLGESQKPGAWELQSYGISRAEWDDEADTNLNPFSPTSPHSMAFAGDEQFPRELVELLLSVKLPNTSLSEPDDHAAADDNKQGFVAERQKAFRQLMLQSGSLCRSSLILGGATSVEIGIAPSTKGLPAALALPSEVSTSCSNTDVVSQHLAGSEVLTKEPFSLCIGQSMLARRRSFDHSGEAPLRGGTCEEPMLARRRFV